VRVVRHPESPPQVKIIYVGFLMNCFLETEVEMKEVHYSNYIWDLFRSMQEDMARFCSPVYDLGVKPFNHYVTDVLCNAVRLYFKICHDYAVGLSEQKCSELISIVESLLAVADRIKGSHLPNTHLINTLQVLSKLVSEREIKLPQDTESRLITFINEKSTVTIGLLTLINKIERRERESSLANERRTVIIVQGM
jgi:hypothetical protein